MSVPGAYKTEHIKRPMNSFMCWSHCERPKLSKLFPAKNNADISRMLGTSFSLCFFFCRFTLGVCFIRCSPVPRVLGTPHLMMKWNNSDSNVVRMNRVYWLNLKTVALSLSYEIHHRLSQFWSTVCLKQHYSSWVKRWRGCRYQMNVLWHYPQYVVWG